jgi:hypothetical protein
MTTIIAPFDPFNLQRGSDERWHAKVQEIIYYGDSRFRQALADISLADHRHQGWMQSCLQRELVCFPNFTCCYYNNNKFL